MAFMKPSYNFYKILKKCVGIWLQVNMLIFKLPNKICFVLVCSPYIIGLVTLKKISENIQYLTTSNAHK